MENIWFVSDTHFFHDRIQEFCPNTREGKDAEEMTWTMVERWNYLIKPMDRVYHLGDFSFKGKVKVEEVASALSGQIHLILGNHDKIIEKNKELHKYFASVNYNKHLKVGEDRFILSHFPMAEWWDCHKGTIHCHGHVHGGTANTQWQQQFKIFDVGIDNREDSLMIPFHIDEVLEKMKDRAIMSHHDG